MSSLSMYGVGKSSEFDVKYTKLLWRFGYRVVFGKRVSEELFDDLVDEDDLEIVKDIAEIKNYRRRVEDGRIIHSADLNLARGIGSSILNAAIIYKKARPGRFLGVGDTGGYFSKDLETAIAEVSHHQERRCKTSDLNIPYYLEMRVLKYQNFNGYVCDVRGKQDEKIYDIDNYAGSIDFARSVRSRDDIDGIIYDSVRNIGGNNLVLFRRKYSKYVDCGYIHLDWDGNRIRDWYRVS